MPCLYKLHLLKPARWHYEYFKILIYYGHTLHKQQSSAFLLYIIYSHVIISTSIDELFKVIKRRKTNANSNRSFNPVQREPFVESPKPMARS